MSAHVSKHSIQKLTNNMFMSTENEVTIISKYYFLSDLEICFKFLYQIEKNGYIFYYSFGYV